MLTLAAAASAAAPSPAASAAEPTIQYVEPVALDLSGPETHFDAYGRRFSLSLVDNGRVLSHLPAARKAELASVVLLRGAVDGAPGSWVRLTRTATGIEGAIWDGQDLYAVTTYGRVANKLATALAVPAGQPVVYRLSDLRDALPRDFCAQTADAALPADATALDDYRVMMNELAGITPPVTRQIEISLIGDAALQAADADPTGLMLARLNIVEGIFSAQLGLLVLATDVRLMPAGGDPLTSTNGAALLEQLGNFRKTTAEVRARGIAHLVTGKNLDGSTAGIAYVGTVCDAQNAVSVSEHQYGTTISALIMAHELGHNFGASHDGEANTACAGASGGFIMAPAVSGGTTFSQCSAELIAHTIETASCVAPADYADVSIGRSVTGVTGEGGQPFTLPFLVRSTGNRAVEGATATVTLPSTAGLVIDSAASSTGSCTVEGLTATCALGTLGTGESHSLSVTARASAAASFTAQARVSASNDRVTSNNNEQMTVTLRSGVDAAVSLSASATELPIGAPLELYVDVGSLRSMPLRNASLTFNLSQSITSAALPGSTCIANAFSVTCSIVELPAGATRRLTVHATTTAGGPLYVNAGIAAPGDGDVSNNNASLSGWVRPAQDIDLTASAGSDLLGVGAPFDLYYTLRSRGSGPADAVTLEVAIPAPLVFESADVNGGTCAAGEFVTLQCAFGTLAPGEQRVVRVRVRGTRPASTDVLATAVTPNDGHASNNSLVRRLRVDHQVDLGVTLASGGNGVEGAPLTGQVVLRSSGRETVRNATLDVVLSAAGTLHAVRIYSGETCTLLSAQRARCALPALARNAQLYVDYEATFAEAGSYDVSFVTATPGDTAPENDSLSRMVLVRPAVDIAVAGTLDLSDLVAGQVRERTFTVSTARRGLATARFVAPHYLPGLRVTAIRATAGDCRVDGVEGGVCDFVDLAANASVPVTVTYAAEAAPYSYNVVATVATPGDIDAANDVARGIADVHGMTDLALRVGTSVGGPKNATLAFPEIALVNGAGKAFGTRLEIALPPEVSLVGISASNAICSGTTVLRCDFSALDSRSTSTVQLSVRAAEDGRFTASLKLSALNAPNAASDVAIEVAGTAQQTAATGAKGGGRFEWITLIVLGALVWRRLKMAALSVS